MGTEVSFATMRGSALTVLLCLIVAVSCGRKKNNKDKEEGKEESGQQATACEVKYFWEYDIQYKTQCSETQSTECSTSYTTQCSTKTQTNYETQCTNQTIEEPVETCTTPLQEVCINASEKSYSQQCSTTYATKCFKATRNKRGTKEKKNAGKTGGETEASVECHKVPQLSCKNVPVEEQVEKCSKSQGEKTCIQSSKFRDVETCSKIPVESQKEECQQVPHQSCHEVPSQSCAQVAVRVPRKVARRVCH